jgi:MFS family permease
VSGSAFAPLRGRVFLVLWLATIVGNLGSWMRDVASGWTMTALSPSPLMVALVQAAATLPVFLLSLPAGAVADLFDRRRTLVAINLWLGAVSLVLALLVLADGLSPLSLLLLTFAGGVGAAMIGPVWQSVVPELVPRAELRSAVALNSLGINIARAIGPALGGLVLAAAGAAVTYLADVLTYAVVIAALLWWQRERPAMAGPPEHLWPAMRAGLRYAAASPPLRRVLLRAALFFLFASAPWALLPLVARQELGGGPGLYGLLLGAVGAGAILGALAMPRLRARFGAEGLMLGASLGLAAVLAGLALAGSAVLAVLLMLLAGVAWITALTTLNATAQGVLPDWVRGRGLALYLTVFYGAMTAGSLLWGQAASLSSVPLALGLAALLAVATGLAQRRLALPEAGADLAPSNHWPEPMLAAPVPDAAGPVLVTVTYRIDPARRDTFLAAIAPLGEERRRNGAYSWQVYEDAAEPGRMVEVFLEESWEEHLRHHRRVTAADAEVQAGLAAFHIGEAPPEIRHLLGQRALAIP